MLNAIRDMIPRLSIGNQCLASAGLAASGADALTATAVTLTIDGVFNAFAAQAAIDISALPAYDFQGCELNSAVVVKPGFTAKFVFAANASDAIALLCGAPMANDSAEHADWPPLVDGYAPFGGVKVVNAGTADFVPGTTAFNAAGITATFINFQVIPPRSV